MVTLFGTKDYILIWVYVVEIYLKEKNKVSSNSLISVCQHPASKPMQNNIDSEQMSYQKKKKKKRVLEHKTKMVLIRK